ARSGKMGRRRSIDIDPASGDLRSSFDYDRALIDRVKALPRRRWSPEHKVWFAPRADSRDVVRPRDREHFAISWRVQALLAELGFEGLRPEAEAEAEPAVEAEVEQGPPRLKPSQINERARLALTRAFPEDVWVVGEISG